MSLAVLEPSVLRPSRMCSARIVLSGCMEKTVTTPPTRLLYMVDHGLLSADVAVVACGAQPAKGSDALSGAALAGRSGGVVLLVNGNTTVEPQHFETIEGGDSLLDSSFLTNHRYTVDTSYMLGGSYVMPESVLTKVKEIILAA